MACGPDRIDLAATLKEYAAVLKLTKHRSKAADLERRAKKILREERQRDPERYTVDVDELRARNSGGGQADPGN
jgi:hypothetical protein